MFCFAGNHRTALRSGGPSARSQQGERDSCRSTSSQHAAIWARPSGSCMAVSHCHFICVLLMACDVERLLNPSSCPCLRSGSLLLSCTSRGFSSPSCLYPTSLRDGPDTRPLVTSVSRKPGGSFSPVLLSRCCLQAKRRRRLLASCSQIQGLPPSRIRQEQLHLLLAPLKSITARRPGNMQIKARLRFFRK